MKRRLQYGAGVFIVAAMFMVGIGLNYKSPKTGAGNFSSELTTSKQINIADKVESIKSVFSDRSLLSYEKCSTELNKVYDDLNSIQIEQFNLAELKRTAPSVIKQLFDLRIYIRENFQAAYFENPKISAECAFSHRRVFRAIRVLEDYIGMLAENVISAKGLTVRTDEKFYRVFEGNEMNFMWNDKYKPADPLKYEPQSGDVVLSRGSASVSAAIARITDEDSNFSHAGIIYVDPVSKKIETVEAHIEFGTLVADIADYKDMKVRSVVFRLKRPGATDKQNAEAAHEAATKVRAEVLKYKAAYGKSKYPNPCYDFGMRIDNPTNIVPSNDLKTRKCIFCSEVVSLAYSLLTKDRYNLPTYKSPINPKNRKFLNDIGVEVKETFAPADMEIEPYFDMVLEWRDYIRVHKSHVMDSILTSMYAWMDDYDYQFYVPLVDKLKSNIAFTGRRIPFFDRMTGLDEKFPLNMSKNALYAMLMLDEVSNQLAAFISDGEKANNVTYTPAQMNDALNAWRKHDADDYKKGTNYNTGNDPAKAHRFHHLLRPKK
tara:strand:- start:62378 stop:64012 length:1635 start_codon:yes stop_codon:yes gene_type:complete